MRLLLLQNINTSIVVESYLIPDDLNMDERFRKKLLKNGFKLVEHRLHKLRPDEVAEEIESHIRVGQENPFPTGKRLHRSRAKISVEGNIPTHKGNIL